MTDTQMLDWVACYAVQIITLPDSKSGERVELTAEDEDRMIVITRRGENEVEAFRRCVLAAMRVMPGRKIS